MGKRTRSNIMSQLLDDAITEKRDLRAKLDKVTAQRRALAISCKNIIRGGVETLKEKNKQIDALQWANKELIDHGNNLIFEGMGEK